MSGKPKSRRPMVMIITAVFLAYAGLIPLPKLLMEGAVISMYSKLLVGLTLVACVALLLPGRNRVVFHLTRLVLAGWVASALVTLWEAIGSTPAAVAHDSAMLPPGQVTMMVCALAVILLFYFFSFGRASRRYYFGSGDQAEPATDRAPHAPALASSAGTP